MRCTATTKMLILAHLLVIVTTFAHARHVDGLDEVQNSYIVTLDSGIYNGRACSIHDEFYGDLRSRGVNWTTLREYCDPLFTGVVVELPSGTGLAGLNDAVGVESVSPVHVYSVPTPIENPEYGVSKRSRSLGVPWSHTMTGVDKAHAAGYHGEGITIGIVDSGIDYTHPALGEGFGPGYKVEGGYDFVGNEFIGESSPPPQPSSDPLDKCNGHGTLVAGILGANPDPERGLVGVAYGASINAYRVHGCRGGTLEDVMISALLRAYRDGNDIILTAVAFSKSWRRTMASALMDKIADRGRILISSIGNHGTQGAWSTDRIGRHPSVIGVGSAAKMRRVGKPKTWIWTGCRIVPSEEPLILGVAGIYMSRNSAIGPTSDMRLGAALAAPGHIVPTTNIHGDYTMASGISMAAPFIAGTIALWLQVKGKSAGHVLAARTMLQNTALPMEVPRTYMIDTVARQGAGLIQVYEALRSKGRMLPSELLLNDTTYPQLSCIGQWGLQGEL